VVCIDIAHANVTKRENISLTARRERGEGKKHAKRKNRAEYDSDAPAGLLKSLQDVEVGVDEKMEKRSLRIFKGSKTVVFAGSDSSDESDSDDSSSDDQEDGTIKLLAAHPLRLVEEPSEGSIPVHGLLPVRHSQWPERR